MIGIMEPPGTGDFGVVDDYACRHAPEEFEGASVAGKPRLDFLIRDDLGILVARPGQHHHEDPRLDGLVCEDVLYRGTSPKVHLRHVARIEVQHGRDVGMSVFELLEKTPDGSMRAGIAAGVHQGLVDDCTPDTLTPPDRHLVLVG